MNVIVTGGAGYIGSHIVNSLLKREYNVVILDDLSEGHREAVPGGILVEGSCGDEELVKDIVEKYNINAAVHLAASSIVGESMENPDKYYRNNVANGIIFLSALLKTGVRHFVFSSTAAVYGEPEYNPIDEEHPLYPINVYGETKLILENIVDAVRRVTGRDFTVEKGPRRGGDPAVLVASSQKIRRELGWQPRYGDLEEIVRTAWEWHRNYPDGFNS